MLTLKKSFHLPSLSFGAAHLELSPVTNEDDELIQAIENQVIDHDDNWTLDPVPDSGELEREWTAIVDDIEHDPEWERFSDD